METIETVYASVQEACAALMSGSASGVKNAQETLLALRERQDCIIVSKEIFETSDDVQVQFQVITAMTHRIVRDWEGFSEDSKQELLSFFIESLSKRDLTNLQTVDYVQRSLLTGLVVLIKRGWLEQKHTDPQSRSALFRAWLDSLLASASSTSPNEISVVMGLRVAHSLVEEFSSEKATAFGLSWDFHYRCKKDFERTVLRHLLSFCVSKLHIFLQNPAINPQPILNLILTIVSWKFTSNDTLQSVFSITRFSVLTSPTLNPPPECGWGQCLLGDVQNTNSGICEVVINITTTIGSTFPHVGVVCRQILMQLALLEGPVFRDFANSVSKGEDIRSSYAIRLLASFVQLLHHYEKSSLFAPITLQHIPRLLTISECQVLLDLSNLFHSILSNFGAVFASSPTVVLPSIPSIMKFSLCLVSWSLFLSSFSSSNSSSIPMSPGDREIMSTMLSEALEDVLLGWNLWVYMPNVPDDVLEVLRTSAIELFHSYLTNMRSMSFTASAGDGDDRPSTKGGTKGIGASKKGFNASQEAITIDVDEEDDEVDEFDVDDDDDDDDGTNFLSSDGETIDDDGLTSVSATAVASEVGGRISQFESLSILSRASLSKSLPILIVECEKLLSQFSASNVMSNAKTRNGVHECLTLYLHLIVAVLTERTEPSEIPLEIMEFSTISRLLPTGDQVLRLISIVWELISIEMRRMNENTGTCSPRVENAMIQFVFRFSRAYLFISPSETSSASLVHELARTPLGGGDAILSSVLQYLITVLCAWDDVALCRRCVRSLCLLVMTRKDIRESIANAPPKSPVGQMVHSMISLPFNNLIRCKNVTVKRIYFRMLSSLFSSSQSHWNDVLRVINDRVTAFLSSAEFRSSSQSSRVREELFFVISMLRGICAGADLGNISSSFDFVSEYFEPLLFCFVHYRDYYDIVLAILRLFLTLADNQLPHLGIRKTALLFDTCQQIVLSYGDFLKGRLLQKSAHDDISAHLGTLLSLFQALLYKYHMNLASEDESGRDEFDDVYRKECPKTVANGLTILLPCLSEPMLQYVVISKQFLNLVHTYLSFFPEEVMCTQNGDPDSKQAQELFPALLNAIESCLEFCDPRVSRLAAEALQSVVKYSVQRSTSLGADGNAPVFDDQLAAVAPVFFPHLLERILDMLLFKTLDEEVIDPFSRLLFLLVWSNQNAYGEIVGKVLQSVPSASGREIIASKFTSLFGEGGIVQSIDRANMSLFAKNVNKFLLSVRGLLNVK